MAKNPIEEAESLFIRKKWYRIIQLLEPQEPMYRENKRFLFLLGTAYLYAEDLGSAYSALRRAQQLDFRDRSILTGLAAVFVRRGEYEKAIQLYIEILERYTSHKAAKRGLSFLRVFSKNQREDETQASIRKIRKNLYPRPPLNKAPIILALFAAIAAAVLVFVFSGSLQAMLGTSGGRQGVSEVQLSPDEIASPVDAQGRFAFVLTQKEALDSFAKAKALFFAYRDEAALVEVNRLLLSNASAPIKAKAEILRRYAREPSFVTLPDRFSFLEVSGQPALYEGVAVAWKGMPANIVTDAGTTRFDLLVGYHDTKKLEGIVEVSVPFDLVLKESGAIEVLAKVRKNPSSASGYSLDCVAVHELMQ